jgi:SAM-dependent methyltransferase
LKLRLKQEVLHVLRSIGLLAGVEWLYRRWSVTDDNPENEDFCREHPDFIPPPLALMHDAYGSISFRAYWDDGQYMARLLTGLIQKHHPAPERVLEWGCGPARILRHLPGLLPEGTQLFGTDYNKESISWCKQTVSNINFVENELTPPLPFAKQYFDAVYAVSVLTHLSAAQQVAWMKELPRVLCPNGILILTTNGQQSAKRLLPKEYARFQNEGVVIRGGVEEGKRCFLSYHHPEYARTHLFSGLQVCDYMPGLPEELAVATEQDIWVLR